MQFIDAAPIAGTRITSDGYLVATVKTARTGIQDYAGHEVGKPAMPVVKVYRPPEQVFSKESMGSYAHKPVTNDHPDEGVSAKNWKDEAVGQIGDEIARDGEYIRIPLIVMDATAIGAVKDGKQELSAGYTCDLVWDGGVTPDGEKYDAVQKNIRINHVAIVNRGRAGSQARIGDDVKNWGVSPVNLQTADERNGSMPETLRKVLVDGLQVETTDAGAAAIEKLTSDKAALSKSLADAEKAHADAIAAKDAELAKKDAEIDDIKAKVLSDADLDKRVQDRAALITVAKTIAKDVKTDGLSDADIRKAVVSDKLGADAIKDKAQAYIDARFDILAEDAAKANDTDPVRDALIKRDGAANDPASDAYAKMVADMQSAHLPVVAN
jgi:hypothetical protein